MVSSTNLLHISFSPAAQIVLGVIFSGITTWFAIPVIVRVARLRGFVEHPNGRTSHKYPTPNLGGIAIFFSIILTSILFTGSDIAIELKYIIAGTVVLFFIGLKDDFYPLVPYKKFIGQFFASFFIIIPGDIRIIHFHNLFGLDEVDYIISIIVTFLIVIALINSFNFIDGVDGLAAGIGILASLLFGLWFWQSGYISFALLSFSLTGSLVVFFWFNVFHIKYKIFLGDTGAMIIGFIIAILAIRFNEYQVLAEGFMKIESAPAITLCILIVPLFDALRIVVLRIIGGRSPFSPDKNHIHHRLLTVSNSHLKVTLLLVLITVLFILLGIILNTIGNGWIILTVICIAAALSNIPVLLVRNRN